MNTLTTEQVAFLQKHFEVRPSGNCAVMFKFQMSALTAADKKMIKSIATVIPVEEFHKDSTGYWCYKMDLFK